MHRYRNLVVGIATTPDGRAVSAGSRRALDLALRVARTTGAQLTVFHSQWSEDADEPRSDETSATTVEAIVRDGACADVDMELVLSRERPWLGIVRRVLERRSDLVLVGRRSVADGDGRTDGTNTLKLLRKCPSPVWAVAPSGPIVPERVLVATDLTPVGDLAAELGASLARGFGSRLHVLHAWATPLELQLLSGRATPEDLEARRRELRAGLLRRMQAPLARGTGAVPPALHLVQGDPAGAVRQALTELAPDLLVLGTVSRTGVPGLLVGNTAERVLAVTRCSVLTVKPDGFRSPVSLADLMGLRPQARAIEPAPDRFPAGGLRTGPGEPRLDLPTRRFAG